MANLPPQNLPGPRTQPSIWAFFSSAQQLPLWLPLAAGVCALYGPSFLDLLYGSWSSDEQLHGPIVLVLATWLIYKRWSAMRAAGLNQAGNRWGWPVFIGGLLSYLLGRTQSILMLEIGSLVWVLAGIILLILGPKSLRVQWFPLFFMCFMIPLPSVVVDTVTLPMKVAVSYVAENFLFWLGYPVARSGVVLQMGQYLLLVANACAGLQTLLVLEALGLFYLQLVRCNSIFRNITLTLLIIPIGFIANVIRVIALCLVTYHLGDAAGQGFLHRFAGMFLFLSSLLLIIGFDSLLRIIEHRWQTMRRSGQLR